MIDGYDEAPLCSSFTSGSFDIDIIFHVHCTKPVWCVTALSRNTRHDADIEDVCYYPILVLVYILYSETDSFSLNIHKALRTAQLQLDAEKTCNQQLEEKNVVLEANKPSRRSKKSKILEELAAYEVKIRTLAKKYSIMVEMYFPSTEAISQSMLPMPTPAFHTADCYASAVTH